ncbi:MAG TPA: tetratricopeptide repeat protein [Verrucomicrobiae bacterium]|nr:tetratricopeptide repeat protein [Verrucomicrobiae bacterium]
MHINLRPSVAILLLLTAFTARAADDSDKWKHLYRAATKAMEKNEYNAAESLLIAASEIAEKFGPNDERYSDTFRSLGDASTHLHHFGIAAAAYARLADADGERLGTNDIKVANDLLQLVEVAGFQQDYQNGTDAMDRATSIVRRNVGNNCYAMGICESHRADLELQEGHHAAAESNYLHAIKLLDSEQTVCSFSGKGLMAKGTVFAPSHLAVALTLNQLGICQTQEKKYDEAQASLRRSIKLTQWIFCGSSSPALVNPLYNLAIACFKGGDLADAESAARRALSIIDNYNRSDPTRVWIQKVLSATLIAEGKPAEAKKFAR